MALTEPAVAPIAEHVDHAIPLAPSAPDAPLTGCYQRIQDLDQQRAPFRPDRVLCKTDPTPHTASGISIALVVMAGLTVSRDLPKLGYKASRHAS